METEQSPPELRQAAELLRAGKFDQAGYLLARYLQVHTDSADGWVLLSYALEDPAKKRECLERALRLRPNHAKAMERMRELGITDRSERARTPQAGPSQREQEAQRPPAAAGLPPRGPSWIEHDPEEPAQPVGPEETPRRSRRTVWVILSLITGIGLLAGAIGLGSVLLGGIPLFGAAGPDTLYPAATPAPTRELTLVSLPASWTPTATLTITPTATASPTRTVTPTPSLVPPNATQQAEMAALQLEVADMRGLPIASGVSSYLLTRLKAREVLEGIYRAHGGTEALIEDRKHELVALGLVKPTYNMLDNILNSLADNIGGFFDPLAERLYVIGGSFGGVERYVYAHEFGHALVDQHFHFDQLGAYPICQRDQDRCKAISGLVEGDATLVMYQWLVQYASPQDLVDLRGYSPPDFALPEQFPPPFAVVDAEFPYLHGADFVQFLYNRGNWAEVDRAYANLPASTEQILHPEKYLSREAPIAVQLPALEGILGPSWRLVAEDVLGEWGTYLLLGYGADLSSQLHDGKALYAAQGWGGDRYLVYVQEPDDRLALAALWQWDNAPEADEFHRALTDHLQQRYRGGVVSGSAGSCWQANNQASCIYLKGSQVLWLSAPDQGMVESMLVAFVNFP